MLRFWYDFIQTPLAFFPIIKAYKVTANLQELAQYMSANKKNAMHVPFRTRIAFKLTYIIQPVKVKHISLISIRYRTSHAYGNACEAVHVPCGYLAHRRNHHRS